MTPDLYGAYGASQAIAKTIIAHLGGEAFLSFIKDRRRLICGKFGPSREAREECLRISLIQTIPRKIRARRYLTVHVQPNGLYGMELIRIYKNHGKRRMKIIETRHDIAGADLRRAFAEITGVTKLMETN